MGEISAEMPVKVDGEPHGWNINITCPRCRHRGDAEITVPCCDHVSALKARVAELEGLTARSFDELGWAVGHGKMCEARIPRDCETCDSTDEADEHCNCFLALRRDLKAALSSPSDWLATHDAPIRATALEEAAKVGEAEQAAYRASARRCDSGGNTIGGSLDASGAVACGRIAGLIRSLAAAPVKGGGQ